MGRFYRIMVLCYLVGTNASQLQAQLSFFQNTTWEEVKQQAVESKRMIFVDVYTTWCAPCKKMDATVFNDGRVARYVNEHFVSLKLDAEKNRHHSFFSYFKPSAYPTYYWLDETGELLSTHSGYLNSDDFLQACQEARQGKLGERLNAERRRWERGERGEFFLEHFLFDILPQVYPDSVRHYLNVHIGELSIEQRKVSHIGRWVSYFVHEIEDDLVWNTLLVNNDVYTDTLGVEVDLPRKLYLNLVRLPMAERENTEKRDAYIRLIASKNFPYKDLYMSLLEMETNLFSGHFTEALEQAVALGGVYEKTHPHLYREMYYSFIIGRFFVNSYRPSSRELELILQLAEKSLAFTPSKSSVSYLAAAYARMGDFRRAYETLATLPFHEKPMLSNAVYSLLNLPRKR